jgi:hypothetical protein
MVSIWSANIKTTFRPEYYLINKLPEHGKLELVYRVRAKEPSLFSSGSLIFESDRLTGGKEYRFLHVWRYHRKISTH